MSNIITSMIVSFGAEVADSEIASIELDIAANLDKTSFVPGDIVNFLIHYDQTKLKLIWVRPTSGSVIMGSSKTVIQESSGLLWIDTTTKHSLSYIPSGSLTPTWFGNSCSGIRMTGLTEIGIAGGTFPAVCNLTFPVAFTAGKLYTPSNVELQDDETYPVIVVAHFERK